MEGDITVRIGAYAIVECMPRSVLVELRECECGSGLVKNANYCHACGAKIVPKTVTQYRDTRLSDLIANCGSFFVPISDRATNTFVVCGHHDSTYVLSTNDPGAFGIRHTAIDECLANFENRYKFELDILREKCFSVKVEFGVLVWEN